MTSADQTPGPPIRAYYMTTREHAISSIEHRQRKVARISEVNDPFELLALDCMKKDVRKALVLFRQQQDRTRGLLCFTKGYERLA